MNIEELAFKDYHELKDIQKIDLLLIIEFLQKDRKQWVEQFTKTHNEGVQSQNNWNRIKAFLKDWKNELNFYNEDLDLKEEHTLMVVNEILRVMLEIESGNNERI